MPDSANHQTPTKDVNLGTKSPGNSGTKSVIGRVTGSLRSSNIDNLQQKRERAQRLKEERERAKEEAERAQCTFSPAINTNSEYNPKRRSLSEAPKPLQPRDDPEATFSPEISKASQSIASTKRQDSKTVFERLVESKHSRSPTYSPSSSERPRSASLMSLNSMKIAQKLDGDGKPVVERLYIKQKDTDEKIQQLRKDEARKQEEQVKALKPQLSARSLELTGDRESQPLLERLGYDPAAKRTSSKKSFNEDAGLKNTERDQEIRQWKALDKARREEIASLKAQLEAATMLLQENGINTDIVEQAARD